MNASGAGQTLEYEPTLSGGARLDGPAAFGARFALGVGFTGEQDGLHPDTGAFERLPASAVLDLALRRSVPVTTAAFGRLDVVLAVDNLLDEAAFDQLGLPAPGRTFRFGVRAWREPAAPAVPAAAPARGEIVARTLAGDRAALARAISWVENEAPESVALLDACFARTGAARRIGITGPPGAGKSTLVTRIAQEYRYVGLTVGIVAVDPTSPFSGGALLGDRVRMAELAEDPGVFIRSMATRGSLGGLAVHTAQVCDVLDAAGYERILIETVGVGQSELEVAQTADTTAVVLVPESGDGVQAMKAGLMEIGDVFVINKADREGAERGAFAVRSALELRAAHSDWDPPVLLTVASQGTGVAEVVESFESHLAHMERGGTLASRRRQRLEQRLHELLRAQLWEEFRARVPAERWKEAVEDLANRAATPHQIARRLTRP